MTQMHFGKDFAEILLELSASGAEFLVVGGHALTAHRIAYPTRHLELWIRPTAENAQRVWTALVQFGVPVDELTLDDFATPGMRVRLGNRIDLTTGIAGANFDEAWRGRFIAGMGGGAYPVIGKAELSPDSPIQ